MLTFWKYYFRRGRLKCRYQCFKPDQIIFPSKKLGWPLSHSIKHYNYEKYLDNLFKSRVDTYCICNWRKDQSEKCFWRLRKSTIPLDTQIPKWKCKSKTETSIPDTDITTWTITKRLPSGLVCRSKFERIVNGIRAPHGKICVASVSW